MRATAEFLKKEIKFARMAASHNTLTDNAVLTRTTIHLNYPENFFDSFSI